MDKPPLITLVMNISFYVLLSILLILWIFSIIFRRYRVYTRNRRAVNIVGSPTNLDLPHGLDSSVIDTFPKFCYSRADQGAGVKSEEMKMRGGECVVCLGGFEEKETLRLLPKCGHVFHADCIDTWLRLHATCPFCRDNLLPESTAMETATATDEGSTRVEVVIDVNDGRER